MIEREVHAAALLLEQDLMGTLDLLHGYRREDHLEQAIAGFAHTEAHEEDLITTRMVASARTGDAFGIAEAFA